MPTYVSNVKDQLRRLDFRREFSVLDAITNFLYQKIHSTKRKPYGIIF